MHSESNFQIGGFQLKALRRMSKFKKYLKHSAAILDKHYISECLLIIHLMHGTSFYPVSCTPHFIHVITPMQLHQCNYTNAITPMQLHQCNYTNVITPM